MDKKLYIGNLPFSISEADLRDEVAKFGTVTSSTVVTDRDSGRSRGFGFIEMADGASEAIETMDGTEFQGRTLAVNEARPRENRQGGGPSRRDNY